MSNEEKSNSVPPWMGRFALGVLFFSLVLLAFWVAQGDVFESGSEFGYNLGLVGGLLMLSLLIYPVRKRFFAQDRLGSMEGWFKYHMLIGISSPIIILFHSTFQVNSVNGAFALYSMLLVALSGVIGRFIYRRVHLGMHGKQMTLEDVSAALKSSAENMGSVFALSPEIEERLLAFRSEALEAPKRGFIGIWQFLTLGLKGRKVSGDVRLSAKRALRNDWEMRRGDRREQFLSYRLAKEQIDFYVHSVVQAAQFKVWERVFSVWHLIHVPFLYLLVFSGVAHVIAVHMY